MKKIYFIIVFLFVYINGGYSQDDLHRLNAQVKNPYIKPEEVDAIVQEFKKISTITDSSMQQMVFETYRLTADRYAASNHFKQAVVIYQDYLTLKEKTFSKQKAQLIESAVKQNAMEQDRILSEIKNLKNEIASLESNEQQLKSRNASFFRNTALLVILFTGIFAFLFLRMSLKLKKIKEEVNQSRQQLVHLEKKALIGRLNEQVSKNSLKQLEMARSEITALQSLLKQMEPGLVKEQMSEFKKIKDSFIKAEGELKILTKEQQ